MRFVFAIVLAAGCSAHGGDSTGDAGGDAGSASRQCDPSASPVACNGNDVVACNPDGSFGATEQSCGMDQQCVAGTCTTVCTADGVDLVYVVDEQKDLLSFDPRLLPADPFKMIGTLSCPTTGSSIQTGAAAAPVPFSMSVDRDGVAWVLYNNGQLFQVSITTAACTAAGNTVGASGMNLFGMGFSTDAAGGSTEHLFLAGGNDSPQTTPRKLAYDDTHSGQLTPTVVGNIAASSDFSPELTGTNQGQLFGFFPNLISVAYVQQIDKTSGAAVGAKFNLGTSGLGAVTDWAFAQWNGVFYVFVTTQSGMGPNASKTSTVRSIDPMTGAYTVVLSNVGYYIDGAGVSTCAPSVLQ